MNTTSATPGSAIADRLAAEFASHIPRDRIEVLVAGCLVDLQGIPVPDLPELGERLARQRLLDLLEGPQSIVA
ncbi:three-helix bundle dimerization domain-containing protein [Rhodococcus chondri]|uniref:Uncharacterized protein n=1 Tax=Rhodococcus chondri TaxID=3065941 RepID=A0ABU7JUY8_9NOCA|nr:hypothetical protein [Rhodococcus sp. CC-R104]MEE2033836.1 hypothetical protein [Rhodococcus sp. CC-R104]